MPGPKAGQVQEGVVDIAEGIDCEGCDIRPVGDIAIGCEYGGIDSSRDREETEKEDEKGDGLADLDDALDDLDAMAAIEELEGMEAI